MAAREFLSEQEQNIEFVKEVEKRPCLYNFELASYARKDTTDQAWEEIGRMTNMTASACRERWRNIRAVFMRTVKGQGKRRPYYLAESMEFIRPFMRRLTKTKNQQKTKEVSYSEEQEDEPPEMAVNPIKIEHLSDEADEDVLIEQVNVRKRALSNADECVPKKVALSQNPVLQSVQSSSYTVSSTETTDHIRSFVDSLIPELGEMNATQFKIFKRRVLVLIDDIMANTPTQKPSEEEYIYSMRDC